MNDVEIKQLVKDAKARVKQRQQPIDLMQSNPQQPRPVGYETIRLFLSFFVCIGTQHKQFLYNEFFVYGILKSVEKDKVVIINRSGHPLIFGTNEITSIRIAREDKLQKPKLE